MSGQRKKIINLDDPDLVLPDISMSESDEDVREITKNKIHASKRLLEKTTNVDIDIENINIKDEQNADKIRNIFTYENNDIIIITDKNMKIWFRGKDIAIALEYSDLSRAISRNVSEKYRKSLADIRLSPATPQKKIDPQTIFIDQTGLFQLITRKKDNPICERFTEWLSEEVIPSIMNTGRYVTPTLESDVERITKSFYDDNMLSSFENNPVVYLIYIGEYDGKHKIKWGLSTNFVKRDLDQHRKNFKTFNVIGIWKTMAYKTVEDKMKINFLSKGMVTPLKIKTTRKKSNKIVINKQTEIITLDEVNNLDYCIKMIENLVKTTTLPQEQEYIEEIRNLKVGHKYELIEVKYKKSLKQIKLLEEQIKLLEEHIKDLRKINKQLKESEQYSN